MKTRQTHTAALLDIEGSEPLRLAVKLRRAGLMLDASPNTIRKLIDEGELVSFLDDGARKVTIESLRAYMQRRLDDKEPSEGNRRRIERARHARSRIGAPRAA